MQNVDSLLCPSFSSYSSDRLAEIATKAGDEFKRESQATANDDDEFEFALVLDRPEASPDKISPVFPVFNRDIPSGNDQNTDIKPNYDVSTLRLSLKNLFLEDREPPSSSSSEDELEVVPTETYCEWKPKVVESSAAITCKKSRSTGLVSKRFKIRDLIRRCKSDGKDSFLFLTPNNSDQKVDGLKLRQPPVVSGKVAGKSKAAPSAHELFYVQNRAMKENDKRKSYLPYRRDLVGFFASVNGLSRISRARHFCTV